MKSIATLLLAATLAICGGCGKNTNESKTKGASVQLDIATTNADDNSIRVGDDYVTAVHRITAVGGSETFIPEAPVRTAPEPVVDDRGTTNWVSHYPLRPQLFVMKDGRVITIVRTADGKNVERIGVEPPPPETND